MYEYEVVEIRARSHSSSLARELGHRINEMARDGWRYRETAYVQRETEGCLGLPIKTADVDLLATVVFEREKK